MSDLFDTRVNKYKLRNFQELQSSNTQTETISYRETQIWNLIQERLRTLASLKKF